MLVRPMSVHDARQVAALSGQLGYPITPERMAEKLRVLHVKPDNGLFVAEGSETILGWIHVYGVHLLESEPFASIGGLIVAEQARRQGVGWALMRQAEAWTREQGYADVRLRSALHRAEAHAFYQQLGYELTKTSQTFRKVLSKPAD